MFLQWSGLWSATKEVVEGFAQVRIAGECPVSYVSRAMLRGHGRVAVERFSVTSPRASRATFASGTTFAEGKKIAPDKITCQQKMLDIQHAQGNQF